MYILHNKKVLDKIRQRWYNDIYAPEPKENFLEIEDGTIILRGMEEEIALLFDKDGNFMGWE